MMAMFVSRNTVNLQYVAYVQSSCCGVIRHFVVLLKRLREQNGQYVIQFVSLLCLIVSI